MLVNRMIWKWFTWCKCRWVHSSTLNSVVKSMKEPPIRVSLHPHNCQAIHGADKLYFLDSHPSPSYKQLNPACSMAAERTSHEIDATSLSFKICGLTLRTSVLEACWGSSPEDRPSSSSICNCKRKDNSVCYTNNTCLTSVIIISTLNYSCFFLWCRSIRRLFFMIYVNLSHSRQRK